MGERYLVTLKILEKYQQLTKILENQPKNERWVLEQILRGPRGGTDDPSGLRGRPDGCRPSAVDL